MPSASQPSRKRTASRSTRVSSSRFKTIRRPFASELKSAFQISFMVYIPFLVLDMVVAAILTSMGMITLPPVLISLPFKLMLFVLVDGWNVLTGSLVQSFR